MTRFAVRRLARHRNMMGPRGRLLLFSLGFLLAFAPICAQEMEPCDPKDGLLRGPLEFSDLTGGDIQCTRTEDRNGVKWRHFHLTATGGSFKYTGNREVLRGKIVSLDLLAARNFRGNSPTPQFEILPKSMHLRIALERA